MEIATKITIPDYTAESKPPMPNPLKILDEYAANLVQHTAGHVRGKVFVAPFLGMTRYTFYLVVPAVNDYTDPLFYVWNKQADQDYPILVLEAGAEQEDATECTDADALTTRLNAIFGSSWAKSRIRHWIELAAERTPRM